MRKPLKVIIIILATLVISIFVVLNSKLLSNGTAAIINDIFILSFLGTINSFSITVIALLYSNIEKIRESLNMHYKEKKYEIESSISEIFKELHDNTLFIFLSLVICILSILLRDIDLILINNCVNIIQIVSIMKLTLILLTLYAVKDNFLALINLIKVSREIDKKKINGGQS